MTATTGDICILLSERSPSPDDREWLRWLQNRLGGFQTENLHVTCHRIRFRDDETKYEYCRSVALSLSDIAPIEIHGGRLVPVFSDFRNTWIVKCNSHLSDELRNVFDTLDAITEPTGALTAFEHKPDHTCVPITVLEGIESIPDPEIELGDMNQPIFTANRLVITEIGRGYTFTEVASLDLA